MLRYLSSYRPRGGDPAGALPGDGSTTFSVYADVVKPGCIRVGDDAGIKKG